MGPQTEAVANVTLTLGAWKATVTVDDDLACRDAVGVCVDEFQVFPEPPIMVSHWMLDGDLLDAQPAANHGTLVGYEDAEGDDKWAEIGSSAATGPTHPGVAGADVDGAHRLGERIARLAVKMSAER